MKMYHHVSLYKYITYDKMFQFIQFMHFNIMRILSIWTHDLSVGSTYRCSTSLATENITCPAFSPLGSLVHTPCPLSRWTRLLLHQWPVSLGPPQCGWLTQGTGQGPRGPVVSGWKKGERLAYMESWVSRTWTLDLTSEPLRHVYNDLNWT